MEKASNVATAASYTASGSVGLFGLANFDHWMLLIGAIATVFTAAVNWHYRRAHFRLDRMQAEKKLFSENGRHNKEPDT